MDYGLIGAKLGHSFSRPIHEAVGGYSYELHPLPTEAEARSFLEARAFKAINVTIPYKKLVMEYCDEIEPLAAAIGAVNTVVNRDGKLYGYNTDYAGFAYLCRRHGVQLAGKTVLLLGTGGTHNTVEAVCRKAGAKEILTVSRTGKNGSLTYAQAAQTAQAEIVVNTTPAGMYPDTGVCLLDLQQLPRLEAVLDVVYNPLCTELLLRAKERGVPAYCGLEMLVAQAVYAAQHFTGGPLPGGNAEDLIAATHQNLLRQIANIALVGMPGCGKSTLGRQLAKQLGRELVDLDAEIEKAAGIAIPEIFEREGEEGFRRREAEITTRYGKEHGLVIACGGGVVKNDANVRALHQNGPVLWLRRPVEQLSMAGRPLSSGREALYRMEAERRPLYQAASDGVVENTGTPAQTAANALDTWQQILQSGKF